MSPRQSDSSLPRQEEIGDEFALGTQCEKHPGTAWPHGDCVGPGMPLSEDVLSVVYVDALLSDEAVEAAVAAVRMIVRRTDEGLQKQALRAAIRVASTGKDSPC